MLFNQFPINILFLRPQMNADVRRFCQQFGRRIIINLRLSASNFTTMYYVSNAQVRVTGNERRPSNTKSGIQPF